METFRQNAADGSGKAEREAHTPRACDTSAGSRVGMCLPTPWSTPFGGLGTFSRRRRPCKKKGEEPDSATKKLTEACCTYEADCA